MGRAMKARAFNHGISDLDWETFEYERGVRIDKELRGLTMKFCSECGGEMTTTDVCRSCVAKLKNQRDELLTLCEKLAVSFERALECEDGWAPWDYQLVEKAQAAIARASSGSAIPPPSD